MKNIFDSLKDGDECLSLQILLIFVKHYECRGIPAFSELILCLLLAKV